MSKIRQPCDTAAMCPSVKAGSYELSGCSSRSMDPAPAAGAYSRRRRCAIVLFPLPEPPTMNVSSPHGRKRSMPRRTSCAGREGYAKKRDLNSNSPLRRAARRLAGAGGSVSWMTVRREASDALPLLMIMSWGGAPCSAAAPSRHEKNTVMTSDTPALPWLTRIAPYQNPTMNMSMTRKSLRAKHCAQTMAWRTSWARARATSVSKRASSAACALCALTVAMAAVVRSAVVLASANARRSAIWLLLTMRSVPALSAARSGSEDSVTSARVGSLMSARMKHATKLATLCTSRPVAWLAPMRTSSVSRANLPIRPPEPTASAPAASSIPIPVSYHAIGLERTPSYTRARRYAVLVSPKCVQPTAMPYSQRAYTPAAPASLMLDLPTTRRSVTFASWSASWWGGKAASAPNASPITVETKGWTSAPTSDAASAGRRHPSRGRRGMRV
jgi:hypothetical protein